MKIMLLGNNTPFGQALDSYLKVFNMGSNIMSYTAEDVWGLDNIGILKLVMEEQPDRVINCAESTNLLEDSDSLFRKNVVIPHLVAHACLMVNVGGHFFVSRAPLLDARADIYSKTKREAESVIMKNYPKTSIIRIGVELGHDRDSILHVLKWVVQKKKVNVKCSSQNLSFTYLPKAVEFFVKNFVNGYVPYGQYNLYSNGLNVCDIVSAVSEYGKLGLIAESTNNYPGIDFGSELMCSSLGERDYKVNHYKITIQAWCDSMESYKQDYVEFLIKGMEDANVV